MPASHEVIIPRRSANPWHYLASGPDLGAVATLPLRIRAQGTQKVDPAEVRP
jgi:hypothetical protein